MTPRFASLPNINFLVFISHLQVLIALDLAQSLLPLRLRAFARGYFQENS
jgi:hypothetical protein